MALLDSDDIRQQSRSYEKTKHPGVCLAGFFAFLFGTALLVHIIFNAFT